jgi:hypothetical protein
VPKTSPSPDAVVQRNLARLVQRLRETGGDNLLGVAVYGTSARSRPSPGTAGAVGATELNVLVVLRNASLSALLPVAPVLTSAQRQAQVSSFVTTPEELRADAEVFPARLLEIRLTHQLLFGDVHLQRLPISSRGLRFAALQELKNLEIRLRHRIVNHGTDPDLLWGGIVQTLPRLVAILETVLHAQGGEVPAERSEVLRLAAVELGVEPARVEPLGALRLRAKRPNDEVVRDEVAAYLALLSELVRHLGRTAAADGTPPVLSENGWDE